jgi:hypothetical protein
LKFFKDRSSLPTALLRYPSLVSISMYISLIRLIFYVSLLIFVVFKQYIIYRYINYHYKTYFDNTVISICFCVLSALEEGSIAENLSSISVRSLELCDPGVWFPELRDTGVWFLDLHSDFPHFNIWTTFWKGLPTMHQIYVR